MSPILTSDNSIIAQLKFRFNSSVALNLARRLYSWSQLHALLLLTAGPILVSSWLAKLVVGNLER